MLSVYPYGTGSLYTASYALSASYANTAQTYFYAKSASLAGKVLYPRSGSMGKGVCLLTNTQYATLQENIFEGLLEVCPFPTQSIVIPTSTPVVRTLEVFPYNIEIRNTHAATASYAVTASVVQSVTTASIARYGVTNTGPTGPMGMTVNAIIP